MNELLLQFWKWAQISPDQYAESGFVQRGVDAEFQFPLFEQLVYCATKTIEKGQLSANEIDDVLTIMALDNEAEDVLLYLQNISNLELLSTIIKAGICHVQPHARWQIAELIFRTKIKGYEQYLIGLSFDSNAYVRQRAYNCLRYLGIATDG